MILVFPPQPCCLTPPPHRCSSSRPRYRTLLDRSRRWLFGPSSGKRDGIASLGSTVDDALKDEVDGKAKSHRTISECYFAVKGAALVLPHDECRHVYRKASTTTSANDIQQHLQSMFHLLRHEDTLKMAVKLESVHPDRTRYLVVVSCRGARFGEEESCLLGVDCQGPPTLGLVLPILANTAITLDGDGGFSVTTDGRHHIFKPVSVQAMWSALQTLHKASALARDFNHFSGGTHHWVADYDRRISSHQSCLNEWNAMEDIISKRPPSPDPSKKESSERETTEKLIHTKLKELMTSVDLDEVTSKFIRTRLEEELNMSLSDYKPYIDQAMLTILGQMDAPTQILSYLYLGSEWNASNLEELNHNGVTCILNVTREIDNFFPGKFDYLNVRVWDDEATEMLQHWDKTFKYIQRAKKEGFKVLVHCKMGISRSASVVIAYVMKAYDWDLQKALHFVKEKRNCIKPNQGFIKQLEIYQGILGASKHRHNSLWRSKSETNLKSCPSAKAILHHKPPNKKSSFFHQLPGCLSRPKSWSPNDPLADHLMNCGKRKGSLSHSLQVLSFPMSPSTVPMELVATKPPVPRPLPVIVRPLEESRHLVVTTCSTTTIVTNTVQAPVKALSPSHAISAPLDIPPSPMACSDTSKSPSPCTFILGTPPDDPLLSTGPSTNEIISSSSSLCSDEKSEFSYDKESIPWTPGTVKKTKQQLEERSLKRTSSCDSTFSKHLSSSSPSPSEKNASNVQRSHSLRAEVRPSSCYCPKWYPLTALAVHGPMPFRGHSVPHPVSPPSLQPKETGDNLHTVAENFQNNSAEVLNDNNSPKSQSCSCKYHANGKGITSCTYTLATPLPGTVKQQKHFLEKLQSNKENIVCKEDKHSPPSSTKYLVTDSSSSHLIDPECGVVKRLTQELEAKSKPKDGYRKERHLSLTLENIDSSPKLTKSSSTPSDFSPHSSGCHKKTNMHKLSSICTFIKIPTVTACKAGNEVKKTEAWEDKIVLPSAELDPSREERPALKPCIGGRPPPSLKLFQASSSTSSPPRKVRKQQGKTHPLSRLPVALHRQRHPNPIYNTM